MNWVKQIISYLQLLSGTVLFASIPIYFNSVTRWSMIVFLVTSLIDGILQKRYAQTSLFSMEKLPFWACIATYALLYLYLPIDHAAAHWSILAESRLAFLLFGIVGIIGTQRIPTKILAYTSIIVSVCLIAYVALQLDANHWRWDYWYKRFNYVRSMKIHAHMAFNMYLNIAMASCFWLIKNYRSWLKSIPLVLLILLFYGCTSISDGRIGILCGNIMMAFGVIYLLPTTYKKWAFAFIPIAVVASALVIGNHYKMQALNKFTQDDRFVIWSESFDTIKESPLLGHGAGESAQIMLESFKESEVLRKNSFLVEHAGIEKRIVGAHPHNQWLQSWMEHGIAGLLCATLWLLVPFICLIKNKSHLLVITLWGLIILQLLTDTTRGAFTDLFFCYYLLIAMNYAQKGSKEVVSSTERTA